MAMIKSIMFGALTAIIVGTVLVTVATLVGA